MNDSSNNIEILAKKMITDVYFKLFDIMTLLNIKEQRIDLSIRVSDYIIFYPLQKYNAFIFYSFPTNNYESPHREIVNMSNEFICPAYKYFFKLHDSLCLYNYPDYAEKVINLLEKLQNQYLKTNNLLNRINKIPTFYHRILLTEKVVKQNNIVKS